MNKKYIICLLFVFTLFIPINVFAEKEVYDVVLFFGQSNMTGCAGWFDSEKVLDERVKQMGIDDFSKKSGIDVEILKRYTRMNHVDVDIEDNTAYEYMYLTNSLKKITSSTEKLGENLKWDPKTNSFIGFDDEIYFASEKSYGTNVIPQFVSTYYKKTGRKVIVVMVGNGGEEIAHFLPNDLVLKYSKSTDEDKKNQYIYELMEAKYKAAIKYLEDNSDKYTIGKKFYIVFQGESDAGVENTDYYKVYEKVHNLLTSKLGIEYGGIIETSSWLDRDNSIGVGEIHLAQSNLISNHDDIFLASSYPYDYYVSDKAHYKGDNYIEDLANAKLGRCVSGGNENNAIHFNSASLSQIGLESANAAVEYLTKNNNWLTTLYINDKSISVGDDTSFRVYVNSSLNSVRLDAIKLHDDMLFVEDYGPRIVSLNSNSTNVKLKVKYRDEIKTYSINIIKENGLVEERIVPINDSITTKSELFIITVFVSIFTIIIMIISTRKYKRKK